MITKADKKKIIRDLEEEFSDEKMAEIFRVDEEDPIYVSGRQGRLTWRGALRRGIIFIAVIVFFIVTLQFFTPRIVYDSPADGLIVSRDCIIIATKAYSFGEVEIDDIVAYEVHDAYENGGVHEHYARVIGFSGNAFEVEDDQTTGGLRFINAEQINGKVVFRLFPVSRIGVL